MGPCVGLAMQSFAWCRAGFRIVEMRPTSCFAHHDSSAGREIEEEIPT